MEEISMKYYVIYGIVGENLSKVMFATENRFIAEDFCKKYDCYFREEYTDESSFISLTNVVDNCVVESESLYSQVACPYCGQSYFIVHGAMSTAVFNPTIIKDGAVVHNNTNDYIENCTCLNCN